MGLSGPFIVIVVVVVVVVVVAAGVFGDVCC